MTDAYRRKTERVVVVIEEVTVLIPEEVTVVLSLLLIRPASPLPLKLISGEGQSGRSEGGRHEEREEG